MSGPKENRFGRAQPKMPSKYQYHEAKNIESLGMKQGVCGMVSIASKGTQEKQRPTSWRGSISCIMSLTSDEVGSSPRSSRNRVIASGVRLPMPSLSTYTSAQYKRRVPKKCDCFKAQAALAFHLPHTVHRAEVERVG